MLESTLQSRTYPPKLSEDEVRELSAEVRALASRAQRGDPRPQLPARPSCRTWPTSPATRWLSRQAEAIDAT